MPASSQTGRTRASDDSRSTAEHRSDSSRTTVSQPIIEEISRWSPDTSSLATATTGGAPSGHRSGSQQSTIASMGDSIAATYGSSTSDTAGRVAGDIARTESALVHGSPPAPLEERIAERLVTSMTANPEAAQQLSSSGRSARVKRGERP
ncbi:hypothetical protein D8B26_002477 [Coccidioides posadasii str. Silveira]|uniref:Predicted protein n=1 Tax=Coccidioides posadasii (strain RMSCC 757 / Silveira) TaxID=443226 RepID=E9DHC5_COCPS|nr:predicted protein [Coccidioides posadasii str. Silveira]QVM07786.1 hypothetical protein D8B26_002477 [Coccidioides posadasii str. Silveira]